MARIPRLSEGGNPSSVVGSAPLNTNVANIMGSVGNLMGGMAEIAGAEEAAEQRQRKAELEAEYKRLKEAQDAKQAIVDASEAGRISTDMEGQIFSIKASMEQDPKYLANPELFPEDFKKNAREVMATLQDEQAVPANPRVRLAVTKASESTLSSEYQKAFAWVSSQQSAVVKGNLARKETSWANAARGVSSEEGLKNMFAVMAADPDWAAVYGKNSPSKIYEQESRMAQAQLESLSERAPITARKKLESGKGFYGEYIKDFTSLRAKTERDALNLADVQMLDTLSNFGDKGNQLLTLANAGEAHAGVISAELMSLEVQRRKVIDNTELTPEAKKKQFTEIEKQKKFVKAAELWQARNTRSEYVGEDDVPDEIWVARNKIFAQDNPPLGDILDYRKQVLDAANNKRMSPGKATTLMQEVALATPAAIDGAKNNTGWWFWKNDVQAGTRAAKAEIELNAKGTELPAKTESRVYSKYVELYTQAQKNSGEMPNREAMIKMAKQAFYLATDIPMPKDLRK